MPSSMHNAAARTALFLLCLSTPAGATEDALVTVSNEEAHAAEAGNSDDNDDDGTSDQRTLWTEQRWVLTSGLTVLVDNWSPGGTAVAGDVTLGGSLVGDWIRFGGGVFVGQGPATPYYCLPCGGTQIPVAPTLRVAGVHVSTELRVPLGPVQPFVGFRQGVAIAQGLTEPLAHSVLLTFTPRVGVEVPLRSGWSTRMSVGFEAISHRWVLGDALPLPGASRLPHVHNRAVLGISWAKVF